MKKIVLVLLIPLLCGCNLKKEEPVKKEVTEKEVVKEPVEKEEPITLSLYVDNAFGGLDKVSQMHEEWVKKRDIVVFGAIYSDEDRLDSDYFQNIWKKYIEGNEKYKLGWTLKFGLSDGTKIDRTILSPKDVEDFYDYLEIYLYDSANKEIGVWYSHLLEEEMNEETIITSMKLTCGENYEMINTPIEVSVFAYENDDDFKDGKYIGNNVYNVMVYNG